MVKEGKKKPIFKRWWFWVVIVVIVIGIIGSASGGNKSTTAKTVNKPITITKNDYITYYNGVYLWRQHYNNTVKAALSDYQKLKKGKLTLDQFHTNVLNTENSILDDKSSYGSVPESYNSYDDKLNSITNKEKDNITTAQVSNGQTLKDAMNKLKTLSSQFETASKEIPKSK